MATARPLGCAAKPTSFSPFSGRIVVSKMSKPASRRICALDDAGERLQLCHAGVVGDESLCEIGDEDRARCRVRTAGDADDAEVLVKDVRAMFPTADSVIDDQNHS